jgi:ribosome maturation factor RimP
VYSDQFHQSVHAAVQPLLDASGYGLVELTVGRRKGSTRVCVVIYRRDGVGVDDCAQVSSLLLPRLETVEGIQEVSLEVSSPGIQRSIRFPAEYALFAGRGVRILHGAETEWELGIIDGVEGDMLWLKVGRERRGFALAEIRRARLDHSVEVEEGKNAV